MKRSVLIAVIFLTLSSPVKADWPEGSWYSLTRHGRDILIFKTNDNLIFQSDHEMDDQKKSYRLFGKWKYQLGVCLSGGEQGVNEGATVEGNLMLTIDLTQCCLIAEPQDKKLALKKVWTKGSGLALHAYCSDNLLIPVKLAND